MDQSAKRLPRLDTNGTPLWRIISALCAFGALGLAGYYVGVSPQVVTVIGTVATFYVVGQWLNRNPDAVLSGAGAFRPIAELLVEGVGAERASKAETSKDAPPNLDAGAGPQSRQVSAPEVVHWRVDWVLGLLRGAVILIAQVVMIRVWLRLGLPDLGLLHWITITGSVAAIYVAGHTINRRRAALRQALAKHEAPSRALDAGLKTLDEIERRRGLPPWSEAAFDPEHTYWRHDAWVGVKRGAAIATANALVLLVWHQLYSPIPAAAVALAVIAILAATQEWGWLHGKLRHALRRQSGRTAADSPGQLDLDQAD